MNDELMERLAIAVYEALAGRPQTMITAPSAMRARDTILSELSAAGFVVVPEVPTEEMVEAGDHVMRGRYGCSFETAPIFSTMLRARPKL